MRKSITLLCAGLFALTGCSSKEEIVYSPLKYQEGIVSYKIEEPTCTVFFWGEKDPFVFSDETGYLCRNFNEGDKVEISYRDTYLIENGFVSGEKAKVLSKIAPTFNWVEKIPEKVNEEQPREMYIPEDINTAIGAIKNMEKILNGRGDFYISKDAKENIEMLKVIKSIVE